MICRAVIVVVKRKQGVSLENHPAGRGGTQGRLPRLQRSLPSDALPVTTTRACRCSWGMGFSFVLLPHFHFSRLCELVVKSEADVLTLIEQGGAVRKVASTNMNERSSRSHSCFTIKVSRPPLVESSRADDMRNAILPYFSHACMYQQRGGHDNCSKFMCDANGIERLSIVNGLAKP